MEANDKRVLYELIQLVREGGDTSFGESALFGICDDLGYVEYLCKMLTPEQLESLNADGKLWPSR